MPVLRCPHCPKGTLNVVPEDGIGPLVATCLQCAREVRGASLTLLMAQAMAERTPAPDPRNRGGTWGRTRGPMR